MNDPLDALTLSTAELTTAMRAWLRARRDPPPVQASAMAYEIAAIIALHATSVPQAFELIDYWTRAMKEQVRELGVGVEHP